MVIIGRETARELVNRVMARHPDWIKPPAVVQLERRVSAKDRERRRRRLWMKADRLKKRMAREAQIIDGQLLMPFCAPDFRQTPRRAKRKHEQAQRRARCTRDRHNPAQLCLAFWEQCRTEGGR